MSDSNPADLSQGQILGGNAAGGILGAIGAAQAGAAANSDYQNALSNYNNVLNEAQKQNFQVQLQQAGMTNYNPAVLQNSVQMAPNAAANLGPNQQVMAQQMANNANLQGVSQSGYTPEMMAAYNQMQQSNNANAQATMKSGMQSAAARGMGASGATQGALAAQAAQSGLNAANTAAGNIAAQGFQNKLAAMGQLGSLSNAQQSQLSGLAAQQAQMTNQYNTTGTTLNADIAARNVAAQNQQQNLQTNAANQFSQYNTGIANQQAMQNDVTAQQQAIADQLAASGGAANAYGNMAGATSSAIKGEASGIGSALSSGVAGLLGMV